jgi:hypothetical protein
MAMELYLVEGGGSLEHPRISSRSNLLPQMGQGFPEGEMPRKFHKANQVAAALTAVAVEQIFAGVDIERRPGVRVQRTKSGELLSRADAASGPVVPLQVLQQRNLLFELFQISSHGADVPFKSSLRDYRQHSQARMVGGREFF